MAMKSPGIKDTARVINELGKEALSVTKLENNIPPYCVFSCFLMTQPAVT